MTTETIPSTGLIHKYPLISFSLIAILLGGGTMTLVVLGVIPSGLALVSALLASLAGIIMIVVEEGKAGLKRLLSRLLIWRVHIGYWLFATLFILLVVLLGSLANPLFHGDSIDFSQVIPGIDILPMFLAFFIISGLGQELGWSGYLMPRLQKRYSALDSALLRAILVGIWHLPLYIYSSSQIPALADFPYGGWIAHKGFLVAILALFALFLIPWSIFTTWIFNNTRGSLLLASVLHGSEIWVAYTMLKAGIRPENLDNFWGYGTVILVIGILIVLINGPQDLSRQHKRVVFKQLTESNMLHPDIS